ncbi:unnamed protein product [Acanthosepion pharaonis]|uniref:Uncharacterized protein n=1 Tax=Acanthosepion pharaonis TaxID=158019 RepID=A0A812C8V0_ACAPH|nr:unnamed protein product [Sepia pharaonis]
MSTPCLCGILKSRIPSPISLQTSAISLSGYFDVRLEFLFLSMSPAAKLRRLLLPGRNPGISWGRGVDLRSVSQQSWSLNSYSSYLFDMYYCKSVRAKCGVSPCLRAHQQRTIIPFVPYPYLFDLPLGLTNLHLKPNPDPLFLLHIPFTFFLFVFSFSHSPTTRPSFFFPVMSISNDSSSHRADSVRPAAQTSPNPKPQPLLFSTHPTPILIFLVSLPPPQNPPDLDCTLVTFTFLVIRYVPYPPKLRPTPLTLKVSPNFLPYPLPSPRHLRRPSPPLSFFFLSPSLPSPPSSVMPSNFFFLSFYFCPSFYVVFISLSNSSPFCTIIFSLSSPTFSPSAKIYARSFFFFFFFFFYSFISSYASSPHPFYLFLFHSNFLNLNDFS